MSDLVGNPEVRFSRVAAQIQNSSVGIIIYHMQKAESSKAWIMENKFRCNDIECIQK